MPAMETCGSKTAAFAVWFVPMETGWEQNSCFCSVVCGMWAKILQIALMLLLWPAHLDAVFWNFYFFIFRSIGSKLPYSIRNFTFFFYSWSKKGWGGRLNVNVGEFMNYFL